MLNLKYEGSHSGSQHSSTGPSNNTGSTNLSGGSVHPHTMNSGNFYHQPGTQYSRGPLMSPVPSVGANSASSTYGGTSSVVSNVSSHPQYPVCYAQSIVPGMNAPISMNGMRMAGPSPVFHGNNNGWVGRFNNSNAAYSGSSDGGKICNL